jgi:hypothetical protein
MWRESWRRDTFICSRWTSRAVEEMRSYLETGFSATGCSTCLADSRSDLLTSAGLGSSEAAAYMDIEDYGDRGLTIQEAILRHAKRFPNKEERPDFILWNGRPIKTADVLEVPLHGVVRAELLSSKGEMKQGFDLKVNGWFELAQGERVSLLRTWNDPKYEPVVEYPFYAKDFKLHVWNIYQMEYPDGRSVDEKWTENAGMWIEVVTPCERIYHCSHGMAHPPGFESLVFKVSFKEG